MLDVAVTGASGRTGRRLVERLAHEPTVGRVVAVDGADPAAEMARAIAGVDALVHLGHPRSTHAVLEAAAAAGVRVAVHRSSAAVYGAWPDNRVPLTEDVGLRPNPGFAFAAEHAEAERLVTEWR